MPQTAVDLIVRGARQLVTCAGERTGEIGAVDGGALAVAKGRIVAAGPEAEVFRAIRRDTRTRVLRAAGRCVVPGFVDPHTHLLFAGWRVEEFAMRLSGSSYAEIAAAGGGILATVRATRAASPAELFASGRRRLAFALRHGTTTIEIKSGYGLDLASERRLLRVARALSKSSPQRVVTTFLGAHALPPEHRAAPERYVEEICERMIPSVAGSGLARFCDVFCERGAFSVEQARRVLLAGKAHGLAPRLHADQLTDLGGAALAAEVGASSADHLVHASEAGLAAMAAAGVVATLLPVSSFLLGEPRRTPVESLRRAGVAIALATDYNPGTSPALSMQTAMRIGCLRDGLTPAECLWAATRGAARALRLEGRVGALTPGARADFLLLSAPDYRHLVYEQDRNLVAQVFIAGERVR